MAPMDVSRQQKEDEWSWVNIGDPFPPGPIRVTGEQNQYVALWYKHGKPVTGRAWNNGGVVECSFPYKNAELTGKKDLGGKIQILSYETWKDELEAYRKVGFVYRWVLWKDRRQDYQQLVRCGDSTVIRMKGDDGQWYCGNIDFTSETAQISYGGKVKTQTTGIDQLYTIVRDLREPPHGPQQSTEIFDVWHDVNEGDDFSRARFAVKAMGRPLKYGPGQMKDAYVALWYKHGKPCSGAMYDNGGKIGAEFVPDAVHNKKIGSLQTLAYNQATAQFSLAWKTYKEAMQKGNGWWAVRVNNTAPCVMTLSNGFERLGKVELSEEKASCVGAGGEAVHINGPAVQAFYVLCRDKPVPGAHYPEDKD